MSPWLDQLVEMQEDPRQVDLQQLALFAYLIRVQQLPQQVEISQSALLADLARVQ